MDVDIRIFKDKALSFPEPVKSLVLSEPDVMDHREFIVKIGTWEKLLRIERETP